MAETETITRDMPVQRRELMIAPDSWNPETRTVDVTWTTGARRRMFDWNRWDYVDEELSLEAGHIRFDRINNGAPVLNTHSSYELEDVIGVVVAGTARIEGGAGIATLQLSRREDVAGLVQDIADGIIRNISVGYMVHEYQVTERPGEIPLMRAVDWEPAEISFVPIPADAAATVRSADAPQGGRPCIIRRNGLAANMESPMAEEAPAVATAPAIEETALVTNERGIVANPVTVTRLLARLEQVRLAPEARAEIIALHDSSPLSERDLNAAIGERFAAREAPLQRQAVHVQRDASDVVTEAIEATFLSRMNPKAFPVPASVRGFGHMSLINMGRHWLNARNVPDADRMADNEVANMLIGRGISPGHTTSDFVGLLGNIANKGLRSPLVADEVTFEPFVRRRSIRDFKQFGSYQLTAGSVLDRVAEAGEITSGSIGSTGEVYSLETFAKIFTLSRQAILNDDLGAFEELPMLFESLKRVHESNRVYEILTLNPLMSDGFALFSTQHGNLAGSGTVIDVASLAAGRAAMLKQLDAANAPLNIRPAILIVGPDRLTQAEQVVTSITANASGSVNPFAGRLRVVTDGRITGNQWFLAADPSPRIGTIELASLAGEENGTIETEAGFRVDGISFKVRIDTGAKAIDWRGLYRNPGA